MPFVEPMAALARQVAHNGIAGDAGPVEQIGREFLVCALDNDFEFF